MFIKIFFNIILDNNILINISIVNNKFISCLSGWTLSYINKMNKSIAKLGIKYNILINKIKVYLFFF